MKKFVNTIAAIAISASFAVQAESTACWEGVVSKWPTTTSVIFTNPGPLLPITFENSGGVQAMIQYITLAHAIALVKVSGQINGQKYATLTTNEMAGGVLSTQFCGQTTLPSALLCSGTGNYGKVEAWLYEPGSQLGGTNFYAYASATIRGH